MELAHRFRIFVLAAAAAGAAQAGDTPDASPWAFSLTGFGTLGVAKTDTGQAVYNFRDQDGGATDSASFGLDSKLGLQLGAAYGSRLSASLQVVSRLTAQGDWNPQVDWAYGKAVLGGGVSLRAGRMCLPYFMVSDFHNVGYGLPWVRPPLDMYNAVPLAYYDGADLSYQASLGPSTHFNAAVLIGRYDKETPGATVQYPRLSGFNASLEHGPVTLRAGRVAGPITVDDMAFLNGVVGMLRQAGQDPAYASLLTLADDLEIKDKRQTVTNLGVALDWNNWVASSEYARRRSRSFFGDSDGWYATAGYRFGAWTPYATRSAIRSQASGTLEVTPPSPALAGMVQGILRPSGQKTQSLGLRWDPVKKLALKAQIDRIEVKAGSSGQFTSAQPGFGSEPVHVYSLAVDFVF